MSWIEFIKNILVMLTLFANIVSLAMLAIWTSSACWRDVDKHWRRIYKLIFEKGLYLGLLISFVATIGSLFYSNVAGYAPCELCWYQRILMYPQVLIFFLAIAKKKIEIIESAQWLSLIGIFMSLYHYSLQLDPAGGDTCLKMGYSVSCSDNFSMNLGYITIPFMAFSAFLLIFIFSVIVQQTQN